MDSFPAERSTSDLIVELEEESSRYALAVIAVAFFESGAAMSGGTMDVESIFIEATDLERQSRLEEAVESGGTPLGLIAMDSISPQAAITTRLFREYQGQEHEVGRILDRLALRAGELFGVAPS
jgi:hypothetical protein